MGRLRSFLSSSLSNGIPLASLFLMFRPTSSFIVYPAGLAARAIDDTYPSRSVVEQTPLLRKSRLRLRNPESSRRRGNYAMVFDFLRQRSEEGIAQLGNIASKTASGKLGEAFTDTAQYVRRRQQVDAENLKKLYAGLAKTRAQLVGDLNSLLGKEDLALRTTLDKLEEILMMADIGAATTGEIIDDLQAISKQDKLEEDDVKSILRLRLIEALSSKDSGMKLTRESKGAGTESSETEMYPQVLFVIGANGMGKTTTIGKVAARLRHEFNQTVLVAACDTYRAAAVDQLQEWTVRAGVDIHRPAEDQDKPAPVLEDAIARAIRGRYDILIVDTSGRLSSNVALNEELRKLKRTIAERIPGGPHETLLVLDGAVGRNAVDQAKVWNREVGLTGLVITKLDGTARGGVVVSIVRDIGVPVKLIGVGEGIDDLRDFNPEVFVDAVLGYEPDKAASLESRLQGMLQSNKVKVKGGRLQAPSGGAGPTGADDIQDRMKRRGQAGPGLPSRRPSKGKRKR